MQQWLERKCTYVAGWTGVHLQLLLPGGDARGCCAETCREPEK